MKKVKDKRCLLDTSPFRNEILAEFKQGRKSTLIYQKYAKKIGYTATPETFYRILYNHVRENHKVDAVIIPTGGLTPATLENFGQRMLELGMAKIANIDPNNPLDLALGLKFKDVIAAQKLIIDSKKLKLSEDAMSIMLGKLFGPKIDTSKAIEGETA